MSPPDMCEYVLILTLGSSSHYSARPVALTWKVWRVRSTASLEAGFAQYRGKIEQEIQADMLDDFDLVPEAPEVLDSGLRFEKVVGNRALTGFG